MTQLHNRVDRRLLKQRLQEEDFKRVTLSFYRYVILENPQEVRDRLFLQWQHLNCLGRIYVAREGINAQMSVPEEHYQRFIDELYAWPEFKAVPFKIAVEDDGKSFFKLAVKLREKIVADGLHDGDYDVTNVGRHLSAEEFNEALALPDTIVVDMRNHYESEVGHFEGAICPDVDTFREELPLVADMLQDKKDKKLLLYCTGGIRCEKASAYFKHLGFEDVNQLHGGIIEYARQVTYKGLPSKFKGKNFVFDERLGERISDEVIAHCHQCGTPADSHTNCNNEACHLLFIQCDACAQKYNGCCSEACQLIYQLPEDKQKIIRKGLSKEQNNIFRKGRFNEKAGTVLEKLGGLEMKL
ncbi:MAG: rhodanese-related sulfurtransferase [Sphingobacteriaceae bacterium]|nr:rhodanese-related sulfurtransferase [Sphingobacteriaceae bacterium]